jgi:hypothetical protein
MDCKAPAEGSALEMIAACFRHQHPEAFGGTPVAGPALPMEVRYGRDDRREPVFTQVIGEEPMGHPEAQFL